MHEASIAQGIIDAVLQEKSERKINRIQKIGVRIGKLSDVVPDALLFAFENLKKETELQKSELVIDHVSVEGTCISCKNEFIIDDEMFVCPKCKSKKISIQKGEELEISYIES